MRWLNGFWIWLLPVVAAAAYYQWRAWKRPPGVRYAQTLAFAAYRPSLKVRLRFLPNALRLVALGLLALAALRPQGTLGEASVKLKGINIMMVVDLSGSMVAEDLKPDRMTAEKKVLTDFVRRRRQDQIGLVIFGAKSFTQAPLTMDHDVLAAAIQNLDFSTVDADGTAIGEGLLTAVNRLDEVQGQTNIIVLATDGTNNRGEDPLKAAEIAAARKIRVYAVGIGAKGGAPIYVTDSFGTKRPYLVDNKPMRWEEPNDEVLKQLAGKTNGEYFRATDERDLERIYARIDRLIKDEKQRRDPHYQELFTFLTAAALAALALERLLAMTWLRALAC